MNANKNLKITFKDLVHFKTENSLRIELLLIKLLKLSI